MLAELRRVERLRRDHGFYLSHRHSAALYCELLYHRKAINPDVDEHAITGPRRRPISRWAAPQSPDQRAYFDVRARESKSMRDLRHQAFQDVELSKEEIQQRKIEARSGDESIAHLEFLFAEYEPRCYLFIIFECVIRLMLTGLLIFIYAGRIPKSLSVCFSP